MKNLTLFSILTMPIVVTIACATSYDNSPMTIKSDERLSHYVTDFLTDCRIYLNDSKCYPPIDLRVEVKTLSENQLGLCTIYQNRLRAIDLDDSVIGRYNERTVIYHELYHCILEKPHVEGELDIMNPYEYEENTLEIYANWEHYVKKVFLRD